MEKINIYIHTSIRSARQQALGMIIWILEFMTSKGEPATITNKKEVAATWKEAELIALVQALGRLNRPCELTIYAENNGIISALNNGWPDKWSKSDWKNAKGEQVEDADWWQALYKSLSTHKVTQVLNEPNGYTSWMYSECGEEIKEPEIQYSTARRALEQIAKGIESLDITVVESHSDLRKLVFDSTETLFKKFDFLQTCENSGFVSLGNAESHKTTNTEDSGKNENLVITVH